jgi:DNA-binding Lrp family transcriptional regulator
MPRNSPRRSFARTRPLDVAPRLFGSSKKDRILTCLSVNGPMHVNHIARSLKLPKVTTLQAVRSLKRSGLVVQRDRRGSYHYVALNRRLSIFPALKSLLLALDAHWPAPRLPRKISRYRIPYVTKRADWCLFKSKERSLILLLVAATGISDLKELTLVTGLKRLRIWNAVNDLEADGIITTVSSPKRRIISLDARFECNRELKTLLAAYIDSDPRIKAMIATMH